VQSIGLTKTHHYCHCLQQGSSVPTAILFSTLSSSKHHHNFPQTFSRQPLRQKNIMFLLIYGAFRLLSLKVRLYWDRWAISLTSTPRQNWKISMLWRLPICEQVMLKHVCRNHFPSSTSTLCLSDIFFVLKVKNPSLNYLYISPSVSVSRINSYFLEK